MPNHDEVARRTDPRTLTDRDAGPERLSEEEDRLRRWFCAGKTPVRGEHEYWDSPDLAGLGRDVVVLLTALSAERHIRGELLSLRAENAELAHAASAQAQRARDLRAENEKLARRWEGAKRGLAELARINGVMRRKAEDARADADSSARGLADSLKRTVEAKARVEALREALRGAIEAMEENLEHEGRLSSFVIAIRQGRAALEGGSHD